MISMKMRKEVESTINMSFEFINYYLFLIYLYNRHFDVKMNFM